MRRILMLMSAVAVVAFASCEKEEHVRYASISISAQMLEAQTKTVTADDMRVFIEGEDFYREYMYLEIPDIIDVPVDKDIPYVISAESISEEDAETLPDIWGQKRYAGTVKVLVDRFMQKDENGENIPLIYPVTVTCTVANSMLSVVFDETVLTYYSDFKVKAYTDENRKLEFTNADSPTAVAHFTAGKRMYYEFAGVFNISGEQKSNVGYIELEPAMHYTLTFRMQNTDGSMTQPVIAVDEYCEDIYETMVVDPSDNGVFEK